MYLFDSLVMILNFLILILLVLVGTVFLVLMERKILVYSFNIKSFFLLFFSYF